ncbi:MAG: thioredoxin domain-containing protein, partial [Planctomycetes bacterium]|nr:thioredoxin domain-containing protein [Planctomycetota bacterium]
MAGGAAGEASAAGGEADGRLFNRFFGVTEGGHFEGDNILNVPQEPAQVAQELGMSEEELAAVIRAGRDKLYRVREQRVHPGLDDKVLTSWNGLMLRSLAEGGAALGRDDYLAAAVANASFLLERLRSDGRVLRTYKDGRAKLLGFLEDYAMLIDGLIALYE